MATLLAGAHARAGRRHRLVKELMPEEQLAQLVRGLHRNFQDPPPPTPGAAVFGIVDPSATTMPQNIQLIRAGAAALLAPRELEVRCRVPPVHSGGARPP